MDGAKGKIRVVREGGGGEDLMKGQGGQNHGGQGRLRGGQNDGGDKLGGQNECGSKKLGGQNEGGGKKLGGQNEGGGGKLGGHNHGGGKGQNEAQVTFEMNPPPPPSALPWYVNVSNCVLMLFNSLAVVAFTVSLWEYLEYKNTPNVHLSLYMKVGVIGLLGLMYISCFVAILYWITIRPAKQTTIQRHTVISAILSILTFFGLLWSLSFVKNIQFHSHQSKVSPTS